MPTDAPPACELLIVSTKVPPSAAFAPPPPPTPADDVLACSPPCVPAPPAAVEGLGLGVGVAGAGVVVVVVVVVVAVAGAVDGACAGVSAAPPFAPAAGEGEWPPACAPPLAVPPTTGAHNGVENHHVCPTIVCPLLLAVYPSTVRALTTCAMGA